MMRLSATNAVLVLANLIPLVGVVFYEWDAILVLALFWIENLIIGAFNLLKMLSVVLYKNAWLKLILAAFFAIHYGLFWTGHGLFLWNILGFDSINAAQVLNWEPTGFSILPAQGASILVSFVRLYEPVIWLGLLGLFLSHLVQFIERFILRGEIFKSDVNTLMNEPYKRVIILHAGLLGGAFLLNHFNSPTWLLALIVALKMIVDVRQYRTAERPEH